MHWAQSFMTLVNGDSKADNEIKKRKWNCVYTGQALNAQEKRGYELFISEGKGDLCTATEFFLIHFGQILNIETRA